MTSHFPDIMRAAILLLSIGAVAIPVGAEPALSASSASLSQAQVLTPPSPETPRVHGPKIFGVRPGSPFLYAIPATGKRPIHYSATGLPAGLMLDATTGQITGRLTNKGSFDATLRATNALGSSERKFRIVVGEEIALTPVLGWNSWNVWGEKVDQAKILAAAKALVSTGLSQHGWTYVNIDDTWQGTRGGPFHAIQPNQKFPDMKGLCDQIHALGLKAGIYSTPWVTSYAGFIGGSADNLEGSWPPLAPATGKNQKPTGQERGRYIAKYSFATQDARQWGNWGVDFLKYDWFPNGVAETKEMSDALKASGRDIVFSLSNALPFEHAAELTKLAQCWRTTGDIRDNWKSVSKKGFGQDKWVDFASLGHRNDPDMLVIGECFGWKGDPRPSQLTPDEQYTHISIWALIGAPLLIGCDLDKLDAFTMGLLTNDEVIDIDQDSLGKQAVAVSTQGDLVVYAKPLDDGAVAVGLFNRGTTPAVITANWKDLGLTGEQTVRDVWRQRDIGKFDGRYETSVAPHGVALLRFAKESKAR